jgi:hypothetical protein
MKFTSNDLNYIMSKFPSVKLSYVKNIHKKVSSANIFLAMPKGGKYFAWFRNFKKYSVCIFLELDNRKNAIKGITIKPSCFKDDLCSGLGTIVYGTMVHSNRQPFFFVEDIFYYKGQDLSRSNQLERLGKISLLMNNNIKQVALNKNNVIFGVPIMTRTRNSIDKLIQDLPYDLYCIQHRYFKKNMNFLNEKIKHNTIYKKIFLVKAEIACDIYSLYYNTEQSHIEKYSTAFISDYKTSVFMNSLFRKIKENNNLDLLEESDDEEEFEDVRLDKFVDIKKKIKVLCVYNYKFKSWIPIEPLEKGEICSKQDIMIIEKKNRY